MIQKNAPLFVALLGFCCPFAANGQPCSDALKQATTFYSQKKYDESLQLLRHFDSCNVLNNKKLTKESQILRDGIIVAIKQQAKDAEAAKILAIEAQKSAIKAQKETEQALNKAKLAQKETEQALNKAELAQKEAEKEREKAIIADSVNQKIVAASYFYKGKYALAYQNGKYGFIDKTGELLIAYTYDHALPFDETLGWALVKKAGKEYYIDTLGKEYLLVRDVNYLDKQVVALDLSNRDLKAIPAEVFKNPQLKFLNLSGNQISRIASVKTLDSLRYLEHLDLSNNLLTNLPDDVYKLTSLKTLQVRGNRLSAIPSSLGRLAHLELLDLSANKIGQFPDSILNLQKLTLLDLSENELEDIPSSIRQLNNLIRLYLQNNELPELPDEIGALSTLKDLNLSYNYLTKLPTTLSERLIPLDLLDVSFNTLTQLPPDLNVRLFFNCSGNRLTERPSFASKPEMLLVKGNPFNSK